MRDLFTKTYVPTYVCGTLAILISLYVLIR